LRRVVCLPDAVSNNVMLGGGRANGGTQRGSRDKRASLAGPGEIKTPLKIIKNGPGRGRYRDVNEEKPRGKKGTTLRKMSNQQCHYGRM